MSETQIHITVTAHEDDDGLWAEVDDMPGVFATGDTYDELWEVLIEAINLYLGSAKQLPDARVANIQPIVTDAEGIRRFLVTT